jgi:prepilin-type N-terminal cleavage/methylation domain-containing protein
MSAGIRNYRIEGERGFSILELCVVMAILAILAAIAVPDYSEVSGSFNRQASVSQVEFDLRRARAEALAAGTRGVVSIGGGGAQYSFGFDYLPYAEPAAAETEEFRRRLPAKITFSSSVELIFDSRGYLVDEDGNLTSAALSLSFDGTSFCSGTVLSTGTVTLSCL